MLRADGLAELEVQGDKDLKVRFYNIEDALDEKSWIAGIISETFGRKVRDLAHLMSSPRMQERTPLSSRRLRSGVLGCSCCGEQSSKRSLCRLNSPHCINRVADRIVSHVCVARQQSCLEGSPLPGDIESFWNIS